MDASAATPGLVELASTVLKIILIDVVLAGDNAVVIALAARALHGRQRRLAIGLGAGAAVVLRVALTVVAADLLDLPFLKVIGGVLVVWIAVKLLRQESAEAGPSDRGAASLRQAIGLIVVADVSMSFDNVLAVAAASKGSLALLLFGLGLSIPFVVFASSLLARWMERFPIITYAGAAILGHVGGHMVMTDHVVRQYADLPGWLVPVVPFAAAAGVIAFAWYLNQRKRRQDANAIPAPVPNPE